LRAVGGQNRSKLSRTHVSSNARASWRLMASR
jgi:hypothetical protein